MTSPNEDCLQPTDLCDFDRQPQIKARALELTAGCRTKEEMFQRLFAFVKEMPYGLEDWDVAASQTLAKRWGMCSGKANLLVSLLRSVGIPARYRIIRIKSEGRLWQWVTENKELAQRLGPAGAQQDHVACEVWLGEWRVCDPSRDTPLERGMIALGMPLERESASSKPLFSMTLASFDRWARERQERRRFRENRSETFAEVNEQFWRIRKLGQGESQ